MLVIENHTRPYQKLVVWREAKDLSYISEKEFDALDDSMRRISYLLFKLRASITPAPSVPSVPS